MMSGVRLKIVVVTIAVLTLSCFVEAAAQCSICTKTASQLGKESAEGLNSGIIYLMLLPFAIAGYVAWRWWKGEKSTDNTTT